MDLRAIFRDRCFESNITGEKEFLYKTYVMNRQNVFSMGSIIPPHPIPIKNHCFEEH